jgi:hypothetical protein
MADEPDLLRALGEELGIDLVPDEQGIYELLIDDRLPVLFQPTDDAATLVISAGLGEIPPEAMAEGCRRLLERNLGSLASTGTGVGLSPESGNVMLMARLALAGLDAAGLAQVLEGFVLLADDWRGVLEGLDTDEAEGEAEAEAEPASGIPVPASRFV